MLTHIQEHTEATTEWGKVPGNCMQTAWASLFDVPVDAVPHLALFGNDWGSVMATWLNAHGYDLHVYVDRRFMNWWRRHTPNVHDLDAIRPTGLGIATGPSLRGAWHHAVVWEGDHLAHDPHPSGAGLATAPTEYWHAVRRVS